MCIIELHFIRLDMNINIYYNKCGCLCKYCKYYT